MLEFDRLCPVTGPPQSPPELLVTPGVDPQFAAYSEETLIKAKCTVRQARPAANLSWFMGELLVHLFLFQ
jgi:hypothetical protein